MITKYTRKKKSSYFYNRLSRKSKLNSSTFWNAKAKREMFLSDHANWSDWGVFQAPLEPSYWRVSSQGKNLTTLRSPHVNKNAQEHFRLRTYTSRQTKKYKNEIPTLAAFALSKAPFFQELESSEKRFFKSSHTFTTYF